MAITVKHADELTLFLLTEAVRRFEVEPGYADKILQRLFLEKKGLNNRDRGCVSEMFYDLLRNKRLLESGMNFSGYKPIERSYLLASAYILWRDIQVPKRLELPRFNFKAYLTRVASNAESNPAIRFSVPDWLFVLGKAELGDRWEKELDALNSSPLQALRANTLKTTVDDLQQKFADQGINCTKATDVANGLVMDRKGNLFLTHEFHEGLFEFQDISSQRVAELLDPKPGMLVMDACAGNGGKTLHLAALMENKGRLVAADNLVYKLSTMRRRAQRAGVLNVESVDAAIPNAFLPFHDLVDRLLLDVPCTGTGVWRRNPEARWLMKDTTLENLHTQQREIIASYSVMVKPGGQMVYSTCSILPSENRLQVEAFLAQNSNFYLVKEIQLFPSETEGDGFYMALIGRNA
ncbi:RsmB/NOP family class I SAM-dependent RNA methyltransferase [Williamwhitmania taraxaci]|nr:RsmB/NOP family class I SAM-dependent RNA methyltransferase [Williamwhitmania taraxaci]